MKPKLGSLFKIAYIHAARLNYAIGHLESWMPVSSKIIQNIKENDLVYFEVYSSRFSKLQDLMGTSIFTAVLEEIGELNETMSFLDKLHKLEKLSLIEKSNQWLILRQLRNNLSHEYPEQPEIMAETFNQAFAAHTYLLNTLDRLHQYVLSLEKH